MEEKRHIPVQLEETIKQLNLEKGKFIIDGTLGGGGHAREIIKQIMPGGKFLGVDLDSGTLTKTKESLLKEFPEYQGNIFFEHSNYSDVADVLKKLDLDKADGIIVDLGFSSIQIEDQDRGFSFKGNARLDARYDQTQGITAEDIVNGLLENELADILYKYGEERFSRQIAKGIVEARKKKRIETTNELSEIIEKSVPAFYKKGKIACQTKTFQALRIYVNKEFENIEKLIDNADKILNKKGRLVVITFHSLEDRIVKNKFKKMSVEKKCILINKKVIKPTREEEIKNPRSRSSKIRVIEII